MKPETFDVFIDAVETGETIKTAIKRAVTSWRSLSLHMERDPQAAQRYARARTISAQWWADRAATEAENATTGEEATIARVRADVYRWRARVANPREYGDKIDVQADVRHTVSGVIALPDEEPVPTLQPPSTVRAFITDATVADALPLPRHDDAEGVGGGDETGTGGVTAIPPA